MNTRIRAGSTVVLDVLANVKGDYPSPPLVRLGTVHETFEGPLAQYGPLVRNGQVVEIEMPYVTSSQINVLHNIVEGHYGDVLVIESPRETFSASVVPGEEGLIVEMYPSPPGVANVVARAILKLVRV